MGIQINDLKLLLEAKKRGASFEQTLTLARLSLQIQRHDLEDILVDHKLKRREEASFYEQHGTGYNADALLRLLGASKVDSVDYSDFEGASIVHDMNQPLPSTLEEKYDAVIDGGTLEHVFNFPVALNNAMRAVKTGGRLFLFQMANNFCGHGFYCFSPELFYRTLAPKFGFQVERMLMYEVTAPDQVFSVADTSPKIKRVNVMSDYGVLILVEARKLGPGANLFTDPPVQSDYQQQWAASPAAPAGRGPVKKTRKHSFLHDLPWYARLQAARGLRRRNKKEKRTAHFGNPLVFERYTFQTA